jgi:hypothetical protein
MAGEVAPWNLLQIAFIVVYPAWLCFTRMPSGKHSFNILKKSN